MILHCWKPAIAAKICWFLPPCCDAVSMEARKSKISCKVCRDTFINRDVNGMQSCRACGCGAVTHDADISLNGASDWRESCLMSNYNNWNLFESVCELFVWHSEFLRCFLRAWLLHSNFWWLKAYYFLCFSLMESNFSRIKITMIMSMMRKTNERASAKSENLLAIARFEQKINLLHRQWLLFISGRTRKYSSDIAISHIWGAVCWCVDARD